MSIAVKLSWELQAMNERDASEQERTALEICYGVGLAQGEPSSFSRTMAAIAEQVTDRNLAYY